MRTAVVALLLAGFLVGSVAGLWWLTEKAAENPKESLFTRALVDRGDLEAFVAESPDFARKMMQELWDDALTLRARGGEAEAELERARRLAKSIETVWQDPSFSDATALYRDMDKVQAARKAKADRLISQAEDDYGRGMLGQAVEDTEAALEIYRSLDDAWGELRAHHLLGNIRMASGEKEAAASVYSELLIRAARLRDRQREAAAMNNLSMLQESGGSYREAAAGYRRVSELGEAHGLQRVTGFALLYQGHLYHTLGLSERAASLFHQAETAFRSLGEKRMEGLAASNRGASLHRSGDYAAALAAYRRALELRSRAGDRSGRVRTLLHLGELLRETGNDAEALTVLAEILVLTRGAEDVTSRRFRWGALLVVGDIHLARGRVDRAAEAYRQAEVISSEVGFPLDRAEMARRRAYLAQAEANPLQAVRELESAVEMIEALRASPEGEDERVRFLATQESTYKDLAHIHLSCLDQPQSAFAFLERSRARALLDYLQGGAVLSSDRDGAPRVVLQSSAEPEPVGSVTAALEPGTVLLHFTVAPRWLGVLAFDHRGLRSAIVNDVSGGELARLAGAFGAECSQVPAPADLGEDGGQEAGETLSRLLLDPVAGILEGCKRLVVVPDGVLFTVPWPALEWSRRYLIETFELVLEPSASAFVRLTGGSPRQHPSPALIVANPIRGSEAGLTEGDVSGGEPLPAPRPLSEAEAEARVVAEAVPHSRTLVGSRASEQAVRRESSRYGMLHFGTHARIVPELPLSSALILAGGAEHLEGSRLSPMNPEDGVLTGYEALGLQLQQGALVTLAACRSAGGSRRAGEGVVGLARAFFEAGAGTVVASIWPVEDRATRELMVRFYQGLSSEGASAARALSEAQSAMAGGAAGEARRHPFFWAGFVLIGDGR